MMGMCNLDFKEKQMKTNTEITASKKIIPQRMSDDGGIGIIHLNGWKGSIIWSRGGGSRDIRRYAWSIY